MVSSAARIEQRGPVFRLHWAQEGVHIKISRIYQSSRDEVHGEITVERPALASKPLLAEQMASKLGDGAMSSSALAEAMGANHDSVRRTLNRRDDKFVRLGGGKWGLREAGEHVSDARE